MPEVLDVLHLDDDPFELERVREALEKNAIECRYNVTSVATVADYRHMLNTRRPDVVLLDIHVDDGEGTGVALASETRKVAPGTIILMCSTADDIATIGDCLHSGADDFISKQSDKGELSLRVFNSYRLAKLMLGVDAGTESPMSKSQTPPVGATMERISKRVPLIIDSAITAVFISGESGVGKEVVADLFGSSLPTNTPFVKVNCGAIAPTLLESELFGHVKGAFTGANTDKKGLLETASGGWIFLDEVATLSPSAQVALLRVLENQEVMRVGSPKARPIVVRVLSATNEPLDQLVKQGTFRADLWQRLREAEVHMPPLRDRPGEIPALVRHFCANMPGGPYQVSGPVMEILCNVSWREGNIRELRNCLRAMTEMHVNRLLTPLAIPERIWEELGEKPATATRTAGEEVADHRLESSDEIVVRWNPEKPESYERLADLLLIEMTRRLYKRQGKLSLRSLAQATGISRSTLSSRLKSLVHKNIIGLEELAALVGISEK